MADLSSMSSQQQPIALHNADCPALLAAGLEQSAGGDDPCEREQRLRSSLVLADQLGRPASTPQHQLASAPPIARTASGAPRNLAEDGQPKPHTRNPPRAR
jgi:hypothetical protein